MTLEQRIEKIERTNRRLRLAVLCMVGGLFASLWFGAASNGLGLLPAVTAAEVQNEVPVQKLIRARTIQVVGDKGQVLISLQGTERGNLFTYNDQGQKMVTISGTAAGNGAIATYAPKTGKPLVEIADYRSDGRIATWDSRTGKKLLQIGSDGSRGGGVNSFDRDGKRYNHIRKPVK